MTALDLVEKCLGNIASRTVQDQDQKMIRSSGQSADSLEIRRQEDARELWGSHTFYYQVHGRKPGKQPPMQSILEWIEAKGIEPVEISKRSLAFLIARKIGQQGTNIFSGKVPALAIPAIIELELQGLEKDLDDFYVGQIHSTILAGLETIFKN